MTRSVCFLALLAAVALSGWGVVVSAETSLVTVRQDSVALPTIPTPTLGDRLWLISTRSMTPCVSYANLDQPDFKVSRLLSNGQTIPASIDEYLSEIGQDRTVVVYVHGYRFGHCNAIRRGLVVHREIAIRSSGRPIDWVVFSWPSDQDGFITHDVREKAQYSDVQGLYLAWLVREQLNRSVQTKLMGYSLGGRVVTGSLHALAGGSLGGRSLPGESIKHAAVDVGIIAPAIGQDWLSIGGYHGLAASNMDTFLLMYNQRDAVLKRYWLLSKVHGAVALGFGRLPAFTPRGDGSEVNLRAKDCSRWIGVAHKELDYYNNQCNAGCEMARMISEPSRFQGVADFASHPAPPYGKSEEP